MLHAGLRSVVLNRQLLPCGSCFSGVKNARRKKRVIILCILNECSKASLRTHDYKDHLSVQGEVILEYPIEDPINVIYRLGISLIGIH